MSKHCRTIAQVILLLSFAAITSAVVAADAITGSPGGVSTTDVAAAPSSNSPPHEGDSATATSYQAAGTTIFDYAGSSLLVISPSQQIDLFAPREKLRYGGQSGWTGGAAGNGGGGLIPEGVITGLGNGVPSSSIGNVSFNSGGNPVSGTNAGVAAVATPEPSSLILLGSGIAIVARRLARAHRQRRTA